MPCAAMKRGAGLEEKLPGSADLEQGVHPGKTRVSSEKSLQLHQGSVWQLALARGTLC